MKTKQLKNLSVRLDEKRIAQAQKLGVDIPALFRMALDRELLIRRGKCPTCGVSRDPRSKAVSNY